MAVGRTFDPDLSRLMAKWLAALLRSLSTQPEWADATPIHLYLETGPTADLPDDKACIAALLELTALVNSWSAGDAPPFVVPTRMS